MSEQIDTLNISRKLQAADLNSKAADAIAEILKDREEKTLVTKRDLRETEYRLKIFIGSAITAATGILIAVKFFS